MYPEAITEIAKASASGIPILYEWGGIVTLLVLFVMMLLCALIVFGWIIWQMYKQNQEMFSKSVDASNRSADAIELLSRVVGGAKS